MIRIGKWIGIIERCGLQYRNSAFKKIGLSGAHHMYIYYLCNHPGTSTETLIEELHINKSNVARALQILEDTGYIHREVSGNDKRVYNIYPTQKSHDALPVVWEKNTVWNEYLLEGFTEEEKKFISQALENIAVNAKKYMRVEENE